MAFKNKSRKKVKNKKITRKGGIFNMKTPKLEKDNIKDWYLYWKSNPDYANYNNKLRYPGYYNIGKNPVFIDNSTMYKSSDIDHIPGCQNAIDFDDGKYDTERKNNYELCGANLSGENKKYYNKYWKCNFPKFDNTINWVEYKNDFNRIECRAVNQFKPIYDGPRNELLPEDEDFNKMNF